MTSHKPEPMQHANALPSNTSPLVKWFDEYGNIATAVACVVMIVGAIWFSYSRTSSARNEAAWESFSQARTAEDFGNIAESFKSTEVAHWARLSEGERLLESGLALMFTDREAGLGDLKKAGEAFRAVVDVTSAPTLARERAQWGLAKVTESQSGEDTSKAVDAYQALLSGYPKSIYKSAAEERIEALKAPATKEFYAWFQQQKPKPADRKKPTDGLPSGHPPLGTSSKEDFSEGDLTEGADKKDTDKKDTDKKDEKKSEKNEAEEKPTDEKKSAEKKTDDADATKPEEKKSDDKAEKAEKKPEEKSSQEEKPAEKPEEKKPESETPAESK